MQLSLLETVLPEPDSAAWLALDDEHRSDFDDPFWGKDGRIFQFSTPPKHYAPSPNPPGQWDLELTHYQRCEVRMAR